MRPNNPHPDTTNALLRLLPLAVVSLAVALAAACGGDDSSSSTPTVSVGGSVGVSTSPGASPSSGASGSPQGRTPSGTPGPPPGPSPVECTNAPTDAGLISQVAFGGDNSIYVPGEPVDITLILANCANNDAVLHYPTSQRYNFIITDPSGSEVWRSSDGKSFEQVEGSDALKPNDRITYQETWDQRDRNGNQVPDAQYKVSAFSVGCSIASRADCQFGPIGFILIQAATATSSPAA